MIFSPVAIQVWATRVALFCLALGVAWVGGCSHERHRQELKAAESAGAVKAKEKGLKDEFDQIRSSKDAAMLRWADYLARDVAGVQQRPARLPEAQRSAACRGSTGTELSREDAEFLVREAARADAVVEDLRESQRQVMALRRACGG